jgi:hypothetical protein
MCCVGFITFIGGLTAGIYIVAAIGFASICLGLNNLMRAEELDGKF